MPPTAPRADSGHGHAAEMRTRLLPIWRVVGARDMLVRVKTAPGLRGLLAGYPKRESGGSLVA